ncbi:MAG: hypothetical protein M0D55_15930 [Elusimicrobiota bacterium]|nr:MAG: hypothetical protein M0D55_15930 [Elusimicrobiota bacterium]
MTAAACTAMVLSGCAAVPHGNPFTSDLDALRKEHTRVTAIPQWKWVLRNSVEDRGRRTGKATYLDFISQRIASIEKEQTAQEDQRKQREIEQKELEERMKSAEAERLRKQSPEYAAKCRAAKNNTNVRKCPLIAAYFTDNLNISQGQKPDPCCIYSLWQMEPIQRLPTGYLLSYKIIFAEDASRWGNSPLFLRTSKEFQRGQMFGREAGAHFVGNYDYTGIDGFNKSVSAFELVDFQ